MSNLRDKVAQYEWTKAGAPGEQRLVAVSALKIDHAYQRSEESDAKILTIARNFSWESFGSLSVMRRSNGELFVTDGQQRLAAVKRRGDIESVPCIITESQGAENESTAFLNINNCRKPVKAVEKFRASVLARRNPECKINEWLEQLGLRVANSGDVRDAVDFPSALIRTWRDDAAAARQAILAQRDINETVSLDSKCHNGLWWLFHNGIQVDGHVEKLRRLGGRSGMKKSIKMYELELGKCASPRGCGVAILQLINYKCKDRRIPIPEAR